MLNGIWSIVGMALALTGWELGGKQLYLQSMMSAGYGNDWPIIFVGYIIPLVVGRMIGWILSRRGG